MKRDMMICKRIMLQIVQTGHFVTENPEEAYHVALLTDRHYVDAKIEINELGLPIKATVGRMTATGHDAYEAEFSPTITEAHTPTFSETYYKTLVENKLHNDAARDKMLATIATGGIGLLFAIASYLKTNDKEFHIIPWLCTLTLWALVLIGLLVADHLGSKAIDKAISQLGNDTSDIMHHYTSWDTVTIWLNRLNCFASILGIVTFAWFLLGII